MTAYLVPLLVCAVAAVSLVRRRPFFAPFLEGAEQGARTTLAILPSLVGLLTAVYMLRASGAMELLQTALAPAASLLGIDASLIPLMLLKPFSGGGSLALGTAVMEAAGADSFTGRVAAVMLGSAETTFYTVAVYLGAVGVTKSRHIIPCALAADLAAFLMSIIAVRLLMGHV